MRILHLHLADRTVELHPRLTVLADLDQAERDALVQALRAIGAGVEPGCPVLLEVHGVLLEADQANLDLLGLVTSPVETVVGPADIPGAVSDDRRDRLRAAEAEVRALLTARRRAEDDVLAAEARADALGAGHDTEDMARRAEVLRLGLALHASTDPEPVRRALDRVRDAQAMVEHPPPLAIELADLLEQSAGDVGNPGPQDEVMARLQSLAAEARDRLADIEARAGTDEIDRAELLSARLAVLHAEDRLRDAAGPDAAVPAGAGPDVDDLRAQARVLVGPDLDDEDLVEALRGSGAAHELLDGAGARLAEALAEVGLDVREHALPAHEIARIAHDWLGEVHARAAWAIGATIELAGLEAELDQGADAGESAGAGPPDVDAARAAVEDLDRRCAEAERQLELARSAVADVPAPSVPVKDLEWHLLARLTQHRLERAAGSVPLVLDGIFAAVPDADLASLLDRIGRMAGSVQLVVVTADPRLAIWARDAGPEQAAVVAPTHLPFPPHADPRGETTCP